MLTAEFPSRSSGLGFSENTDDLLVGKTLLHKDVLTLKALLTSRCINQREADQNVLYYLHTASY
ncbi:hypothetical protein FD644_22930 [Serratia fonticola]|nr:hypothetical protein FD644_22930 [Serratia fonticola]